MNKPNFLIIGAAKSGTTTLYEQLKMHHKVFMQKIKKTNYFALKNNKIKFLKETVARGYYEDFVYNLEDYLALFHDCDKYKAIGEASPIYLFDKDAPYEIKKMIPDVKLIVILRNPIERAFSNFLMHHPGIGYETTKNFIEALELEEERKKNNWWWGFYYKEAGLYSIQLERYFSLFKRSQILILLYEELKDNPDVVYSKIADFLNISPFFTDPQKQYNATKIPRIRSIEKLLQNKYLSFIGRMLFTKKSRQFFKKTIRSINSTKISITDEEYNYLIEYFENDIKKLEKMLNLNLKHWYTKR